jgi:hypothetical protein
MAHPRQLENERQAMTYLQANKLAHRRAKHNPDHAYFVMLLEDDFDVREYGVITYADYLHYPYEERNVIDVVEFCDGQFYYE